MPPKRAQAALTYTRVKVEAVDQASQSLTFKTTEGEVWTLAALSADMLNGLHKGDTCSLEIDFDNRVTKIVKRFRVTLTGNRFGYLYQTSDY